MNGLLIGRFQPFHLGHLEAVRFGLSKVDKLFIGIGSSNKSHQERNPFTADERKEMITSSLDEKTLNQVSVYYIPDADDHDKWTDSIDNIIPDYDVVFSNDDFTHQLFEKCEKKVISVEFNSRESLSRTNIRQLIFEVKNCQKLGPDEPQNILLKIGSRHTL